MISITRFSLVLTLFALLAIPLCAQIGVGVQAGYLSSNFGYNDDGSFAKVQSDEQVSGYVLGVFLERTVSKKFSLQTEINLKQTGSTRVHFAQLDDIQSVEEEVSRTFNYVEVPFLLKYNTSFKSAFNRVTISAMAGPSLSYARNAAGTNTRIFGGVPNARASEYTIEFKEEGIKRIDFGGQLGVQLGVQVGDGQLILDARYRRGFTNMNDGISENEFGGIEDYETTTGSLAFTIGYKKIFGQKAETY